MPRPTVARAEAIEVVKLARKGCDLPPRLVVIPCAEWGCICRSLHNALASALCEPTRHRLYRVLGLQAVTPRPPASSNCCHLASRFVITDATHVLHAHYGLSFCYHATGLQNDSNLSALPGSLRSAYRCSQAGNGYLYAWTPLVSASLAASASRSPRRALQLVRCNMRRTSTP